MDTRIWASNKEQFIFLPICLQATEGMFDQNAEIDNT
jgi:hypothetical protein